MRQAARQHKEPGASEPRCLQHTLQTIHHACMSLPRPSAVGTFCARRVFELARERGVRDLEVSVAVVEIYREGKVGGFIHCGVPELAVAVVEIYREGKVGRRRRGARRLGNTRCCALVGDEGPASTCPLR